MYSSTITLAAISVFLQIGFLLKLGIMVISAVSHIALYSVHPAFKDYYDRQENGLVCAVDLLLRRQVSFLGIALVF